MTEYGARLPKSGNVYMTGTLAAVAAWLAEFSSVASLELVARERSESGSGSWQHV